VRIVFHQHAIERYIQRYERAMDVDAARAALEAAAESAVVLKELTIHGQRQAIIEVNGESVLLVLKVDHATRETICATVLPMPSKTWVEKMREEVAAALDESDPSKPISFEVPVDADGVPTVMDARERAYLFQTADKDCLLDMVVALRKRVRGCHLHATRQLTQQKAGFRKRLEALLDGQKVLGQFMQPTPPVDDAPGIVLVQPVGNCCGDGLHAYDPSAPDGKGTELAAVCAGCRACQ